MPRKKPGVISGNSVPEQAVPLISLAAADIGSNAVRLLFATVTNGSGGEIRMINEHTIRLPVRIGGDVFADGAIHTRTRDRLVAAMRVFAGLMEIYRPDRYLVCGTSALREAGNGERIADFVRRKTGIRIHCISGRDEARFLYGCLIRCDLPAADRYLHIDVGGGSTELVLGTRRMLLTAASFRIGGVRKLNSDCAREEKRMREWLNRHCANTRRLVLTASGGNINRLHVILTDKKKPFIQQSDLIRCHRRLADMPAHERIKNLGMRPDRADIIVPATGIYLDAMRYSRRRRLYVPKINLISGILWSLLADHSRFYR